jgi:hypothetical protein
MDYGVYPIEAATQMNTAATSGGETELHTMEQQGSILHPVAFDWAEDANEEDEPLIRPILAKERLDELLKPSDFNWADDIDNEVVPAPQLTTVQANEPLRPQLSVWIDSTDGEDKGGELESSSELLTPSDGGDSSPAWVRKLECEYFVADYQDNGIKDGEMKDMLECVDMSREDRERGPSLPLIEPNTQKSSMERDWEVTQYMEANPFPHLNRRWEPAIRRCREMKAQGLGPGKVDQATWSPVQFFSSLGPFHPEQSSEFDYRSLIIPELLSYGPSYPDRTHIDSCDFAHPHLKDRVPNWEAMKVLNSGCIGGQTIPRFDVLAYRPGPSTYWPAGGRKPTGNSSALRFVENSGDEDDPLCSGSELVDEDILNSKETEESEEAPYGEDASHEWGAAPRAGENPYDEEGPLDKEGVETPEPPTDLLIPDCLNQSIVAEDFISSNDTLSATVLSVDDLDVYLTYLPWIEKVDDEGDSRVGKELPADLRVFYDSNPQVENDRSLLAQELPPVIVLLADYWIEALWCSIGLIVDTLVDLMQ